MPISESLLKILVCPESKTPLALADQRLVATLNAKISEGTLNNRSGKKISEKIDGGLLRADGKILYPIREDIPILLIEEGIEL